MKYILTIFLSLSAAVSAFCQTDSLMNMKMQGSELRLEVAGFGITFGNRNISVTDEAVESKRRRTRPRVSASFGIASLDFGFNTLTGDLYKGAWTGKGDFLDTRAGKSIRFAWEPVAVNIALDRRSVCCFSAGLRLSADNYRFTQDITLAPDNAGNLSPVTLDGNIRKSKMTAAWAGIPLRLTFRIAHNLRISLAASGDILMKAHTKYSKPKYKSNIPGLTPWRITAGGTITYHKIGVYCDWTTTPLFKAGSDAKTLSIGLRIGI